MGRTITFATMYPVETHAIWSSVAPRFPIMCGIATFTMLVSSSSSTEASDTVMAIRYLKRYRSGAAADSGKAAAVICLVRFNGRDDAHPRPQHVREIHGAVQVNPDRDPLDHLGEVARGVVGRQQRELRARRRRQTLDVTAEMHARVGVHRDIGGIAGRHVGGFGFLEVRRDPDVLERHHRHQRLAGLYELAQLHRLLGDDAGGWG